MSLLRPDVIKQHQTKPIFVLNSLQGAVKHDNRLAQGAENLWSHW